MIQPNFDTVVENFNGEAVIGFPAAANAYYGRPLDQITDLEYFGLLAMLDAPNKTNVVLQPKVNAERVDRIRQRAQLACRDGCFQGDAPVPCAITGTTAPFKWP